MNRPSKEAVERAASAIYEHADGITWCSAPEFARQRYRLFAQAALTAAMEPIHPGPQNTVHVDDDCCMVVVNTSLFGLIPIAKNPSRF